MIMESIQQEVNVYAPNGRALGYLKQLLMDLNGEIEIIVGDSNTHFLQ